MRSTSPTSRAIDARRRKEWESERGASSEAQTKPPSVPRRMDEDRHGSAPCSSETGGGYRSRSTLRRKGPLAEIDLLDPISF